MRLIDMASIRELFNKRMVELTFHFQDKVEERIITHANIRAIINKGEIIEQYPDNEPNPSALIHGYTEENKPLHIVVGIGDDGYLILITAYFPTLDRWENDYKTRKAGK